MVPSQIYKTDKLTDVFNKWLTSDLAKSLNCHCEAFHCLGPNVLVVKTCIIQTLFKQKEIEMHTENIFSLHQ